MSNNITIIKSDNDLSVTKQTSTVTVNKNTVPAGFTNFTTTGDSGTTQIVDGETLTLTGGTGITTSVSGDTVTFSVTDAEVLMQNEDVNGGEY